MQEFAPQLLLLTFGILIAVTVYAIAAARRLKGADDFNDSFNATEENARHYGKSYKGAWVGAPPQIAPPDHPEKGWSENTEDDEDPSEAWKKPKPEEGSEGWPPF